MGITKTVRVIKTYHVSVDAEYGDTEESLCDKGLGEVQGSPDSTEAVILPDEVTP